MKEFRHGLFIGKFYPPHLGHHRVIRLAEQRCDRVTVVVMASVAETIPLADRVAWLRAEHVEAATVRVVGVRCDAPLDLGDDQIWNAQIAVMAAGIRQADQDAGVGEDAAADRAIAADQDTAADRATGVGEGGAWPVDAVFSADGYGQELAERFKARFVALARDGSATEVRRDLPAGWPKLAPATRAGMATRVIVLGAESTGTTTVSRALADHYRSRGAGWADTQWVGEYGREYTYLKWDAERAAARRERRVEPALDEMVWNRDDFDRVATEQTAAEERAARAGSPVLICDTDAFATSIWERRYLGAQARTRPAWSQSPLLPARQLYLLTDHHGVPWFDDGLREGDLAVRAAMTQWFADALTEAGHSWVLLTGTLPQRVALAIRTVDQLLGYRMSFGAPLTGPGFG